MIPAHAYVCLGSLKIGRENEGRSTTGDAKLMSNVNHDPLPQFEALLL